MERDSEKGDLVTPERFWGEKEAKESAGERREDGRTEGSEWRRGKREGRKLRGGKKNKGKEEK